MDIQIRKLGIWQRGVRISMGNGGLAGCIINARRQVGNRVQAAI